MQKSNSRLYWFGSKLDEEHVALWVATMDHPQAQEIRKIAKIRVKKLKGTKRQDVEAKPNLKSGFEKLKNEYQKFLDKLGSEEQQEIEGVNSLFISGSEKRIINKGSSQESGTQAKNTIARIDIEIGLC